MLNEEVKRPVRGGSLNRVVALPTRGHPAQHVPDELLVAEIAVVAPVPRLHEIWEQGLVGDPVRTESPRGTRSLDQGCPR